MRFLRANRRYEYLVVIVITLTGLFLGLAWGGIYPFGELSLARVDALFQYVGFTGWLSDVLRGDGTIAYSFSKSLGGGTISLFAFILSSPINLLSVFFSAEDMPAFFVLLYAIKLSLCSFTCLVFLRHRFHVAGVVPMMLACSYGLMMTNFMAGSNVMWIDGFYMLPLVCLGVYRILRYQKPLLLVVSVTLAILFNWYCAYMVCVYSIVYFIVESVFAREMGIRAWVRRGITYAVSMLCGVLASMPLFYPVIKYMMAGSAVSEAASSSIGLGIIATPTDFLGYFYFGDVLWEPWGNFPVSGLVIVLAISLFFLGKRFRVYKVALALTMVFFYLSFAWPPLSLIWSGLVRSDSFVPRFAFAIMFTLVFYAGFACRQIAKGDDRLSSIKILAKALAVVVIGFALLAIEKSFSNLSALVVQLAAITIFALLVAVLVRKRSIAPSLLCSALAVVLVGTFCCEQAYMIKKVGYPSNNFYSCYVDEYHEYLSTMKQQQESLADGDFFRAEKYGFSSIADLAIALPTGEYFAEGMRGLSHYSSATNQNVNTLLGNLGYCLTPGTRAITYYNSPMLLPDTVLGIKYLYAQGIAPAGYTYIGDVDIPYPNVGLYENSQALSVGFGVPSNIEEVVWTDDPFRNQELWLSALAGDNESDLYVRAITETSNYIRPDADEIALVRGNTPWTVATDSPGSTWRVTAEETGPLYVDVSAPALAAVFAEGDFMQTTGDWEFDTNVVYLGDYKKGQTVDITIMSTDTSVLQSTQVSAVTLSMGAYNQAIDALAQNRLQVQSFYDGYLKGTFEAEADEWLYLTIPTEDGWEVRVNGERVDTRSGNGLFLIPIQQQGINKIEMSYRVPGIGTGIVLCLLGVGLFATWRGTLRLKKRRVGARDV